MLARAGTFENEVEPSLAHLAYRRHPEIHPCASGSRSSRSVIVLCKLLCKVNGSNVSVSSVKHVKARR